MKVVIVTGLSGAGKSQAVNCLEDIGYYCVDNMPPALFKNFIDLIDSSSSEVGKVAMVIDVRGGEFFDNALGVIHDLKKNGVDVKLIYLEAGIDVLIRRYNETRRSHPLAKSGSSRKGIEKEMEILSEVRKHADLIIDTSKMKSMRLKEEVKEFLEGESHAGSFTINVTSFGFKYGIPQEADLVFDVRFIPNPFYVPSLKKLTGNNKKVQEYVMKYQETKDFIESLDSMIAKLIPSYIREGKYNLNIAFGCTGGQHRSVTLANVFSEKFKAEGHRVTLTHREISK